MHSYSAPYPILMYLPPYNNLEERPPPLLPPNHIQESPCSSLWLWLVSLLSTCPIKHIHILKSTVSKTFSLRPFYKKSEIVSASIHAPEIYLWVLHGNHCQVQLWLIAVSLSYLLGTLPWPMKQETGLFLHSPQFVDVSSCIHSANVYGVTYMPSPIRESGDTVMNDTESLISWS